jgi:hypothetical protein
LWPFFWGLCVSRAWGLLTSVSGATFPVPAEAGDEPEVLPPELPAPELAAPKVLPPETGSCGRFSSPADAPRADETGTMNAISVSTTIEAVR